MKYLTKILDIINTDLIIYGDNIDFENSDMVFRRISDVRSAAFYAFGQSKLSNKNVVLIIDGNYLPNIYTVLTEAWFQKTNLNVVALYDSIYDVETNYLDRCTVKNITFIDDDFELFENKIKESVKLIGPKLFNVVTQTIKEEKNDYSNVLDELKKYIKPKDIIFTYNSKEFEFPCKVNNIQSKYKYGVLSKYVGYNTTLKEEVGILICTKECLEVDLNIFNNRSINNKFKVIVKGNIESFRKWIDKNNIEIIDCQNVSKNLEDFYKSNCPTILNIKEEFQYVF